MAAALLRHGARRVGGSVVQRRRPAFTTPAAAEERRLTSLPLLHDFRLPRVRDLHLTPRPTEDIEDPLRLIQERKEKLYDLISLMEKTSVDSDYENRQLLKFLSAQVKPRPDDSLWQGLRDLERIKNAARATVLVSGCTIAYLMMSLMAKGNAATRAAKKQEQ